MRITWVQDAPESEARGVITRAMMRNTGRQIKGAHYTIGDPHDKADGVVGIYFVDPTGQPTKFYIQPPGDKHGNRGLYAVIEGVETGSDGDDTVVILAPTKYAAGWTNFRRRFFKEVSSEAGPAREANSDELDRLLELYALEPFTTREQVAKWQSHL